MTSLRSSALMFLLMATACGYPKTAAAPGPLSASAAESAAAKWPGTTPASLNAGREVFVAKCNDCHGHPNINLIADERWPGILKKMSKKADLTPEQTENVLHFILAARTDVATK